MALPVNPTNGQVSSINGVTHVYYSNISAWTRLLSQSSNGLTISNSMTSTTPTTGALIVTGGAGVLGNVNVGGNINGANSTITGTIITANERITGNVDSTSTTTGSLIVTGGVGISGNLNVGSNLYIGGSLVSPVYASYAKYVRTSTFTTAYTVGTAITFPVLENSFGSDISVNTGNGQVTLVAGRTYRLTGMVPGFMSNSSDAKMSFCWYNETAGAWIGSAAEAYNAQSTAQYGAFGGPATAIFTPSVTTIVSFRILTSNGTIAGIGGNTDFNVIGSYPWMDIQVIGGMAPAMANAYAATGTINNDYLQVYMNTSVSSISTAGADIVFDTVGSTSGTLAYNTSTGYITLLAGKTYSLKASVYCQAFSATTGGFATMRWVDATNSVIGVNYMQPMSLTSLTADSPTTFLETIYTPSTNIQVKLRVTTGSGTFTAFGQGLSWASVTQINQAFSLSNVSTLTATGNIYAGNLVVTNNIWFNGATVTTGNIAADYLVATRITSDQTLVAVNTDLLFNSVVTRSGSLTANTTTGVFTLQAGKTYEMTAAASWQSFGDTAGGFLGYTWVDANSNNVLDSTSSSVAIAMPYSFTAGQNNNATSYLVYTPTYNQWVKVRVISSSGTTASFRSVTGSMAKIVQLNPNFVISNLSSFNGNVSVGGLITSTIYYPNGNAFIAGTTYSNSNVASYLSGGNIFVGNASNTGVGSLTIGPNSFTAVPYAPIQITANSNSYTQINTQNINNGSQVTADWVATANNGTDTTYYVDLGIAGNTYANSSPNNSLGTSLYPNDAYLYAQGGLGSVVGGNLIVGTTTRGKSIKFIAGGSNIGNVVATVANTGVSISGNLTVVGSNVFLGNVANLKITGGTAGQWLQTDGNGNVSFANLSASMGVDTFTAVAGQKIFTASRTPVGNVQLTINGVVVPNTSIAANGATLTYSNVNNGNFALEDGDTITVSYIYGSTSASKVAAIGDVLLANLADGQTLTYSGSNSMWVNSTNKASTSGVRGTSVTLGNLMLRVAPAGNINLQVATVSGTMTLFGSGDLVTSFINSLTNPGKSVTTTFSSLNSAWNSNIGGYVEQWLVSDTITGNAWRLTAIYIADTTGTATISIERLN